MQYDQIIEDGSKECRICGKFVSMSKFSIHRRKNGSISRAGTCNSCRYRISKGLCQRKEYSGSNHRSWKGDQITVGSGRLRARRQYAIGPCERCGKPGLDRHHKDGNTKNNDPINVEILCRRCHMEVDGRLDEFVKSGQLAVEKSRVAKKYCVNCGVLYKPLRKGRCNACNAYFRSHGAERTQESVAWWHEIHPNYIPQDDGAGTSGS